MHYKWLVKHSWQSIEGEFMIISARCIISFRWFKILLNLNCELNAESETRRRGGIEVIDLSDASLFLSMTTCVSFCSSLFTVIGITGFPSLFGWFEMACTSFRKDAIWPGSAVGSVRSLSCDHWWSYWSYWGYCKLRWQ